MAGFGGGFEDSSWELNQSGDYSQCAEPCAFILPGNGLCRSLQLMCLFIYCLFINHKSRKDLRRLTIKDTNTVKLLEQNRP